MGNIVAMLLGAAIGAAAMHGFLVLVEKAFGTVIAGLVGTVVTVAALALFIAWGPQ
jgi:hypothetical protein